MEYCSNVKRGYCRCSLDEKRDMQSVNHQIEELKKAGVPEENIEYEYISGTKENKPKLQELLNKCNEGDIIYCYELSRISRSFKDFFNTVQILKEKKLKLELLLNGISVDFTRDKLDPFTDFFLNIMMAFNSLEVEVIRERVRSGLEGARGKGKILGRPKLTKDDIPDKFYRKLDLFNKGEINKTEFANVMGWSRPKLNRILELNNVK